MQGEEEDEGGPSLPSVTRPKKKSIKFTTVFMAILIVLLAVFVAKELQPNLFTSLFAPKPVEKVEYLPLLATMPAPKCFPVSVEEIWQLKQKKKWTEVVDSMIHHMQAKNFDSLSAFHVGSGDCFMIVRQEDGTLLHMFNPIFRGYSIRETEKVNEVSVACPSNRRVIERARSVDVLYNDASSGQLVMRKFVGQQSLDVQAMTVYLSGKTICTLHSADSDNGLATLEEMISKQ